MGGFHYATGGTQASSLRDIGWGAVSVIRVEVVQAANWWE
jgi:hypothetical protein